MRPLEVLLLFTLQPKLSSGPSAQGKNRFPCVLTPTLTEVPSQKNTRSDSVCAGLRKADTELSQVVIVPDSGVICCSGIFQT